MTLTFPTQAEQALADFRLGTGTISLALVARRRGAEVEKDFTRTEYIFDDDSSLVVTGRGRTHTVRVELP